MFFSAVQVGALQDVFKAPGTGVGDYKAFLLPTGIVFAITGVSRTMALVTDIRGGYFDRLLTTPVARPALLLGLMVADLLAVLALAAAVTAVGLLVGVEFVTGLTGLLTFLALAALWGLAFAGFPYVIALRTGNPAAVGGELPAVHAIRVPDHRLRAVARDDRLDGHGHSPQPCHLPARSDARADQRRLGPDGDRPRVRCRGPRVRHDVLAATRALAGRVSRS